MQSIICVLKAFRYLENWWARGDLNPGPPPCEGGVLTRLDDGPTPPTPQTREEGVKPLPLFAYFHVFGLSLFSLSVCWLEDEIRYILRFLVSMWGLIV